MRPLLMSLAALTLAGGCTSAVRETAERDPVPVATPTGKAQSCVAISQIRNTDVRSDGVIDFRMRGGEVFRNTLPVSCPNLAFEDRFSYRTTIGQLCSVDVITVLRNNGGGLQAGPSCPLGEFQPVTLAEGSR